MKNKLSCKLITIITSITIIIILAILLSVLLTITPTDGNLINSLSSSTSTENQLTNNSSFIINPSGKGACSVFQEKVLFAHRGGNITLYQENTLEIFLDSATKKRSIELDLMLVGSGEIAVFHDVNTLEKTGFSNELLYTPWDVLNQLTYLNLVDGRVYASKPKIPLLSQALEIICSVNPRTNMWFDIKYAFDSRYIVAFLDALDTSPCACDQEQKIVVEVFRDISGLQSLKGYMANRRCNSFISAISYYDYQIGISLETLKSEMDMFSKYAKVIDFPASFVKKFPEILNYNIENLSICNCAYGDNSLEMEEILKNPLINALVYNFSNPLS